MHDFTIWRTPLMSQLEEQEFYHTCYEMVPRYAREAFA